MKRLLLLALLAVAALAAYAPSARAYSSTDRCQYPETNADKLTRGVESGASYWGLGYFFACASGDGPRVGLQRRGCGTCDISTIFAQSTTNGAGYNTIKYNTIKDFADADHCQPYLQYRMFVQSYDAGAYHISYTSWHDGSAWIACP